MTIELSRRAPKTRERRPFGAIRVLDDEIVSEGTSSVIELIDPSAHAELMALRNARQS
jgi:tRNA(Arg) A34 adenosine deaminase TadA